MAANNQVTGRAVPGFTTKKETASDPAGKGATNLNIVSQDNCHANMEISVTTVDILTSYGHAHSHADAFEGNTSEYNGYNYSANLRHTAVDTRISTVAGADSWYAHCVASTTAYPNRLSLDIDTTTSIFAEETTYPQDAYPITPKSTQNPQYQAADYYEGASHSSYAKPSAKITGPSPFEQWYWTPERHEWIAIRMEQSPNRIISDTTQDYECQKRESEHHH